VSSFMTIPLLNYLTLQLNLLFYQQKGFSLYSKPLFAGV